MTSTRKLVLAVPLVGVLLAVTACGGGHRPKAVPSPGTTVPSLASQGLSPQPPDTVAVSQSPVQVAADQQLAQASADEPGLAQFEALKVPAPSIAGGWPRLAVANDPTSWAIEFVSGLLDVDYAKQSRAALGPWLMAQEAPNLLPGQPASTVDKDLYMGLLDPPLAAVEGAKAPPMPSPAQWAADAKAGVRQSVSDLLTQVDPNWQQIISTGWQPPDVRMDGIDVSGLLTVTRGARKTVEHFTVAVATGSARWHSGYGTIEVDEWQVTP